MDTGLQKRQSQSQLHSFNKVSFSAPYVWGTVLGTGTRALGKVTVLVEVMALGRGQTLNKSTAQHNKQVQGAEHLV